MYPWCDPSNQGCHRHTHSVVDATLASPSRLHLGSSKYLGVEEEGASHSAASGGRVGAKFRCRKWSAAGPRAQSPGPSKAEVAKY